MRPRAVFLLAAAALGALVLATASSGSSLAAPGSPAPCPLEVKLALVNSFLSAFNAGRAVAADRLFATKPDFQWYSARGPRTARRMDREVFNRSTLLAYFRRRHRHHEHLTLVPGWPSSEYFVVRGADDYARRPVHGKMDAICRPGQQPKIIVWTL